MVTAILLLAGLRLHPSERDKQHSRVASAGRVFQRTFVDYKVLFSEDVPDVMEWGSEKAALCPIPAKRP